MVIHALMGSISLGILGCSSEEDYRGEQTEESTPSPTIASEIDLSKVFELRIEGRTDEAIELLRSLNEIYPASVEVMIQLVSSLLDARQFSLAAFRFEQALSLKTNNLLSKEAVEAHYLARDIDSSIERYREYLSTSPADPISQLRFARMLADKGRSTESINAFSKASDEATADDCLMMGELFLQKTLLAQAKHWFSESSTRSDSSPTQPLIGLLRVAQMGKNEEDAETIILALEKSEPGILENN